MNDNILTYVQTLLDNVLLCYYMEVNDMANTTITFRTDEKLKKEATKLFESMGMSLSTALNMFMRQSVIKQKYPCSIETEIANDYAHTYPREFFELFGSCVDDSMKEPKELNFRNDNRREKV